LKSSLNFALSDKARLEDGNFFHYEVCEGVFVLGIVAFVGHDIVGLVPERWLRRKQRKQRKEDGEGRI